MFWQKKVLHRGAHNCDINLTLTLTPAQPLYRLRFLKTLTPKSMSHQDSEPEEAITKEEIHGEEPPKKTKRNAC